MNSAVRHLSFWRRALLVAAAATTLGALAPAGHAAAAEGVPTVRERVVRLVNDHRAEAGCPALRPDAALREAAQRHSDRMARTGTLSHRGAAGSLPWDRADDAGYEVVRMAENIARGQRTAADVVDDWMHSRSHRRAILDCAYRDIGVGLSRGPNGPWWTQKFGARR